MTVTKKNDKHRKIGKKMAKGCKFLGRLMKIFVSKGATRTAKFRKYETIIKPLAMYGSDMWILNRD